ncbi:MAG: class I SAM-dependent methyltransferase [Chloroflexi bacterium]|nr:class I SAM-dependent methyltransferase [Chloroflexota bacterium]
MTSRFEQHEAIPIPACNLGHTTTPRYKWNKDGFDYLQCPTCGLIWVSPQLTDRAVAQIYASSFKSKQQAHERPTNFLAYRSRLRRLAPFRQYSRLLDVGCFTGNFLLAAQADGWRDVEGTEVSTPAVEFARSAYGLNIHEGDLGSLDLPLDAYDVVTLSDVIEHVSDPLSTMQRAYQLLRPGGVLYMDTPHVISLPYFALKQQWSVFFPWHRTLFTARSMRTALTQAGFHIDHLSTVGLLPFSTFNAWQAYMAESSIQHTSAIAQTSFVRQHRNRLRPLAGSETCQ